MVVHATNWRNRRKSTTRANWQKPYYCNGDHCGAFVKDQTNISRTSNCNRLLFTYLFRICGPLLFHLQLLIHNNKLKHRRRTTKLICQQPNNTCKPEMPKLTHAHTFCRGVYNTTVVFGKSVSKIVQVFVICGGVSYLWKCIVIYESVCTSRIVFGLCWVFCHPCTWKCFDLWKWFVYPRDHWLLLILTANQVALDRKLQRLLIGWYRNCTELKITPPLPPSFTKRRSRYDFQKPK